MPTTLRKDPLVTGEVYHVMNKSIAGFKIFNSDNDYLRMQRMMIYFQTAELLPKFSQFLELKHIREDGFETAFREIASDSKQHIQIIAYCFMPTHLHLVTKQLIKNGISTFMANILNSYARYFNTKYERKGPLWVGRFKNVHVDTDEQLLHLTRYIHLNSTIAKLVNKAEDWKWSSYKEYINPKSIEHPLCKFSEFIDMKPTTYRKFVEDEVDYQRELTQIKKLTLE